MKMVFGKNEIFIKQTLYILLMKIRMKNELPSPLVV